MTKKLMLVGKPVDNIPKGYQKAILTPGYFTGSTRAPDKYTCYGFVYYGNDYKIGNLEPQIDYKSVYVSSYNNIEFIVHCQSLAGLPLNFYYNGVLYEDGGTDGDSIKPLNDVLSKQKPIEILIRTPELHRGRVEYDSSITDSTLSIERNGKVVYQLGVGNHEIELQNGDKLYTTGYPALQAKILMPTNITFDSSSQSMGGPFLVEMVSDSFDFYFEQTDLHAGGTL